MKRGLLGIVLAVLLSGCGASHAPMASFGPYTIEDLGVQGAFGTLVSLNDNGEVLVVCPPPIPPPANAPALLPWESPAIHSTARGMYDADAFIWRAGVRTALGQELLGGDINSQGQAVVCHWSRASLCDGGAETDLGLLDEANPYTHSEGINDQGQVVGQSRVGNTYHGFLWQDGRMTDLGPEMADARDINNAGTILTYNSVSKNGSVTRLGDLGGGSTRASAINDRDWVVGTSMNSHQVGHAFLWRDGHIRDLGTLGGEYSCATGLNDMGQIVGVSFTGGDTVANHAFIWDRRMLDLNSLIPPDSGWVLTTAADINNKGQVAGLGTLKGEEHIFLLTPP